MADVSIIIPVYNVEDYLQRCLDSLSRQDEGITMEIILVNDGSTDSSPYICRRFASSRRDVVVIDKPNGGLSDARNAGTAVAKGKYVYFLDSDDWLAPGIIPEMFRMAEDEECDIVASNYYYVYPDYLLCHRQRTGREILTPFQVMHSLVTNGKIKNFAWGKLYRADIARRYPFPVGKFFEDSYCQHLMVHQCRRVGYIGRPGYYYLQRPQSISGAFSTRNLDLLEGMNLRLPFIKGNYSDLYSAAVRLYWFTFQQCLNLAETTGDPCIARDYQNAWKKTLKSYADEFRCSFRHGSIREMSQYHSLSIHPVLHRFIDLLWRVADRLKKSEYISLPYEGENI